MSEQVQSTKNEFQKIQSANVKVVFKREFANYFNTPIGYIFLGAFIILMNFLFFFVGKFWDRNIASLQQFFEMVRICYIFFIPAVTMRLWAEERKSGTVEMLLTLSLKESEVIIGKFLSSFAFVGVALAGTFFVPIFIWFFGDPDLSLILGGYLGAWLLGAAYISVGLLISWLTKDQIVAFLVSMVAVFTLFIMGYSAFLQLVGMTLAPMFEFLSPSGHYESLAKGVFDTRDIIYFTSFVALMLYFNYRGMQKKR